MCIRDSSNTLQYSIQVGVIILQYVRNDFVIKTFVFVTRNNVFNLRSIIRNIDYPNGPLSREVWIIDALL